MNIVFIKRDPLTNKICATFSHGEGLEEISTDSQEYQDFLLEISKSFAPTWDLIRQKRDELIKNSDWIFLPDASPKPSKEAWLIYRQSLRDLPQKFSNPSEVVWPEIPK